MAVWGAQPKLLKRLPGCSFSIVGDFQRGKLLFSLDFVRLETG